MGDEVVQANGETDSPDTKPCPWCAEEILVAAKKCKHCGEFLTGDSPKVIPSPETSNPAKAPASAAQATQSSALPATGSNPHATQVKPVWKFASGNVFTQGWRCIAHDKTICAACSKIVRRPGQGKPGQLFPDPTKRLVYTGKVGSREQLSKVGATTGNGLACPKCGGSQFTAKRSKKGKVIGFATVGVGGLVAPKSQVKCVTCGTMFKRG